MIREVSLEEISDGRLYQLNDMVKAGCGECRECFACCRGMGTSVVLDPMTFTAWQEVWERLSSLYFPRVWS